MADTYTVRLAGTRLTFQTWPLPPIPDPSPDGTPAQQAAELRGWFRHIVHPDDRGSLDAVLSRLGAVRIGRAAVKVAQAWTAAMSAV